MALTLVACAYMWLQVHRLERRVRSELISRLNTIKARLDAIEAHLDEHEARLDLHEMHRAFDCHTPSAQFGHGKLPVVRGDAAATVGSGPTAQVL